ncbi:MAG TPA: tetratricopeptide repeat protein [Vitreimonas sp.]|uniref:2OG-Fe(II) oxygenase family protein n=1 Tax=Vitreimonas sp. TaxID=3069702 RepID=UPI002D4684E6|nr:tetratricopeptide repeat protein [Vitreimonas sp.]HYD88352.1 tetratricopeptide repeat protein [Vitreimonas sp.]
MTSPEVAAIASASRELLSQGDAEGAERVLTPILHELRTDAPTLHLMGLIKKAQNQPADAERYFRSAVAHALSNGVYYNDLGVVLQARGEYGEAMRVYRAALALAPEAAAVRANMVRCLIAANDLTEAEREARAYVAAEPDAESWTLLGQVQRALERHDDALVSAEQALKCAPRLRGLRYNHAVALERVGRNIEALDAYERLAKRDLDTPELALHLMRGLYSVGRKSEAEEVGEQAVQMWPGSTALHGALARMRWLRGEGENCAALIEEEVLWRRPSDLALRLAAADVLHRGGHLEKALAVLEEALRFAPSSPALVSAKGIVLDEMERSAEALEVLQGVAAAAPASRSARRNLLSVMMRAGQAREALAIARELRAEEPDEQYLIACESTALRLLGDSAYKRLCDYERLVKIYDIGVPQGFFTPESFNAALADLLRTQHRQSAHPLDQPRPNFSRTSRNLLTLSEPLIKTFLSAIDPHVRDYVARLPAEAEHVTRRRSRHHRFNSLWSIRLIKDGYDINHVHDHGWISGVYIASVLPAERARDPHAGWLKFGEPNRPPQRCGPERMVEPKTGQLLLFPSYFWRGVVPVEGAERLTAEFIVTPS